ncbi:hypothetical protein [Desulfosporosinus sp. BICA1-9]|uniref:hypothetical protein n=1 Tax=Desulfosporosinus sp. BICA1-9 TaxID=1531958 RepID=UPI00054B7688|nr:hypothetical protein [Desulfosporosinus sp. BICA1-9]KJS50391.1 MAG: hypothetical protein VR66_03055 [Peptococcaceae bacterium BRH_c23]KJS88901.1 MAG: hypothetical protein JL57_10240 [Desulfosporosinus sp. BICA1-9]HBW34218.1 hypothetical protein [Desulfosporosinus sp.]
MKVYVSVKQAGKRKEYITKKELVLAGTPSSLRELLTEIVQINVAEYNKKAVEPWIMKYLSAEETENQIKTGKVGFGERKSDKQADVQKAIETVILAFEDGIYRIFNGDNEMPSLDETISLQEEDVLTFIRFTMLAGRMW